MNLLDFGGSVLIRTRPGQYRRHVRAPTGAPSSAPTSYKLQLRHRDNELDATNRTRSISHIDGENLQ